MAFLNKFRDIELTPELIKSNFQEKDLNKNYSRLQITNGNKTPRLVDYYIAGSYGSYSCTDTIESFTDIETYLKNILLSGIRAIHLDLYDENGNVVVKGEKEKNKSESFDKVCNIINNYMDHEEILSEYPFILFLNLKYDTLYYDLSDKIANSLKKYFNDKFPDIRYNFNRYKIGREYITNFKGKMIILLNRYDNGKSLNELTHGIVFDENNDNNDKHFSKIQFSEDNISMRNKAINRYYNTNSVFGDKDKVVNKTKNDIIIVYTDNDYSFNVDNTDEKSTKYYGINIVMNKFKIKEGLTTVTGDFTKYFRNNDGEYQPFMLKPEEYLNNDEPLTIEQTNKKKTLQTELNLKQDISFSDL